MCSWALNCMWLAQFAPTFFFYVGCVFVSTCSVFAALSKQLLISVGKDSAHSVAVFHWQSRTTLFTAPSGPEAVLGCHVVNEKLFVSCGVDHLRLWTRVGGSYDLDQGTEGRFLHVYITRSRIGGVRNYFVWHVPSQASHKQHPRSHAFSDGSNSNSAFCTTPHMLLRCIIGSRYLRTQRCLSTNALLHQPR